MPPMRAVTPALVLPENVRPAARQEFPHPGSSNWEDTVNIHARPAPDTLGIHVPSKTSTSGVPPVLTPSTVHGGAGDRRVFITCGRGDSFVLAVEEGPEWEAVWQAKYDLQTVLAILPILRALGTRILDRSGGELAAATMEAESGFSGARIPEAQSPASPARQIKGAAPRLPKDQQAGVDSTDDTTSRFGSEWESTAR